jgi:hypothetical protein
MFFNCVNQVTATASVIETTCDLPETPRLILLGMFHSLCISPSSPVVSTIIWEGRGEDREGGIVYTVVLVGGWGVSCDLDFGGLPMRIWS